MMSGMQSSSRPSPKVGSSLKAKQASGMIKNSLILLLIISTGGCAVSQKTVDKRISRINYSDGISRSEAIAIAQQRVYGEGLNKEFNTLPHEVWLMNYWEADYVDWLGNSQKWLSPFSPLRHSPMKESATNVHRRQVWLIGFPGKTALHLGFFAFSLFRYYVVIDPKTGEILRSYGFK